MMPDQRKAGKRRVVFAPAARARRWAVLLLFPCAALGAAPSSHAQAPDTLGGAVETLPDPHSEAGGRLALGDRAQPRFHRPAGFLPEPRSERKRLTLALSGGGARGLAHIGVLEVLDEEGIVVDGIAGTSMGAVVGALYGMGYSARRIEQLTTDLDWSLLFSDAPRRRSLFLAQKEVANQDLISLRFRGMKPYIPDALVTGQTLYMQILRLALQAPFSPLGGSFRDLRVPVRIVVTDLNAGEKLYLDAGDLPVALRAGMAIPIIFRPLREDGRLLVDGGAMENIPVDAARGLGGDVVLAVDCASPRVPDLDPDMPWEIANQVTTLMTTSNDSLLREKADVLVLPRLNSFTQTDFNRAEEIIAAGREAARRALPELKRWLGPFTPPRPMVREYDRVRLSGVTAELMPGANAALGLSPGRMSNHRVNEGLDRLLRYLHRSGWGAARLRAEIDSANGLALNIVVFPGIVRRIRVAGVPESRAAMVRREIRIPVGQPLRSGDLLKSITQLHATGRYSTVFARIERRSDYGVDVIFQIEEAPFPRLGLGLGFDSDRKGRYFADLVLQNRLIRQGDELRLRAVYGERDQKYTLESRANRLFRTYLGWRAQAGFREHRRELFDSRGETVRDAVWSTWEEEFSTLFNLLTWGQLSAGLRGEQVSDDFAGPEIRVNRNLAALTFGATLDTEDRKPFPRSGTRLAAQYDTYLGELGSERAFNRLSLEGEVVSPLMPRVVLRLAAKGGVADLTTPATHRFSVGGIDDFTALRPDRFIALRRLSGCVELRYDLVSRIIADAYLTGRYDLAAFSDDENWRPRTEDLIHSFALSMALDTALGPMELWVAFSPESSNGPEETRVAVNLGYRF